MPAVGLRMVPKAGSSAAKPVRSRTPSGPWAGPGKVLQDLLGNLQGDQPRVLVLVDVEDDRAGDGVQQVARRQVAVGLEHHLQREGHVQQADPPGGVERIDARRRAGALLQQRARRRVLDAAGGVVADLLDRLPSVSVRKAKK